MSDRRERPEPGENPADWAPMKERRVWPWVLLAVIVVGVVINVALTV